MNKQQWLYSNKRKLAALNTLVYIVENWPKTFVKPWDNNETPKPLTIGIHDEIWRYFQKKGFKWHYDIKTAIKMYCNHYLYHQAMLALGNKRVDLKGEIAGEISENDVYYHRVKLLNQQRYGYSEGYKQAVDDMNKLMGRYATGKNFSRSYDNAKAHANKLTQWEKDGFGGHKKIPVLFDEKPPSKNKKVTKEPNSVPKRPILKLKVKSNRVLVKRKAA